MNFNTRYKQYKKSIDEAIDSYLKQLDCHSVLKNSMEYSLLAGGKRVRPIMFLACLDCLGVNHKDYLSFAVSLEFIHTYSLIHDDLPALDNDDYRRGKPSNHVVHGEAIAILAGDALLNSAIEICLNSIKDEHTLSAAKHLFCASGALGMVNGQAYDIYYQNKQVDSEDVLLTIDRYKTGKLLTAPLVMASLIAKGKNLQTLTQIGELTGKLFQFTDDLLDVDGNFEELGKTIGKDSTSNKLTAISIFGKEKTQQLIEETYQSIVKLLKIIDNNEFFMDFYEYVKNRQN